MTRPAGAECDSARQRGFTMVELMITVAIASILVAVGAPQLTSMIKTNRLNSISSAVTGSLQQARSDAIRLNRGVLVCASNSSRDECSYSSNWGVNGWLVCWDQDANNYCDAATASLPNPIRIESTVNSTLATVTGPSGPVRFTPMGSSGAAATITVAGVGSGAPSLAVTVAASGVIKGNRL